MASSVLAFGCITVSEISDLGKRTQWTAVANLPPGIAALYVERVVALELPHLGKGLEFVKADATEAVPLVDRYPGGFALLQGQDNFS